MDLEYKTYTQEVKQLANRSGDLYDSGFGKLGKDIHGGSIEFKQGGRIHHTVFGYPLPGEEPPRFSWDTSPFRAPHFTDGGFPKGNPLRHPFGR